MNYKALIKNTFYRIGMAEALDSMLYKIARRRYAKKNAAFRKANPSAIIPPDYYLYETFLLDYQLFFEDGEDTAQEIICRTKKYLPPSPLHILDWGCGISRVTPFLAKLAPSGSAIYGCDINSEMIRFGEDHYRNISYAVSSYTPPLPYPACEFHLLYAFSVFTHIEATLQLEWIKEINRICRPGGIFLFTTHGTHFQSRLLPVQQRTLQQIGVFTKTFKRAGHRMMTTYNTSEHFRRMLQPWFEVLEFHNGADDLNVAGGQDLWVVRKWPVKSL